MVMLPLHIGKHEAELWGAHLGADRRQGKVWRGSWSRKGGAFPEGWRMTLYLFSFCWSRRESPASIKMPAVRMLPCRHCQ